MTRPSSHHDVWQALADAAQALSATRTPELFQAEPQRATQWQLRVGPLLADLSKQRIDTRAWSTLLTLAQAVDLRTAIAALFAGEDVNRSERRPALHTALRAPLPASTDESRAAQSARAAHQTLERMAALVARFDANSGEGITDLVHVGIGGSDLGPRLVCEALAGCCTARLRVHFIANVDGGAVARLTGTLDPQRTFVSLVSKSFTTQETLLNGGVLKQWLHQALGAEATAQRIVSVSSNVAAARAFGIAEDRILPMWDWVGGRYSVWSAVGFPIAAAYGMDAFRSLLAGAHAMDEHYAQAPLERNLPVWLALAGVWNRNALRLPTLAVIPYDDRLRELPAFLQQLEMESNGKGVDENGGVLAHDVVPVIWGSVGTNAQHAFFQALHQARDTIPMDLIGVIRPSHGLRANHQALLANLLAQSAAFLRGTLPEESAVDAASVPGAHEREALQRQKTCPGDRPHSVLLLDELTPHALGALLALYEHKVHAQGRIWGVNSYDQWGVELGKRIARTVLPALESGVVPSTLDASTAALIGEIRARS